MVNLTLFQINTAQHRQPAYSEKVSRLGTDASIRPTLKTNCTTNDKNYQNNPTLADHQIPVGFCEAKEVKFNNYWSEVSGLQRTIGRKVLLSQGSVTMTS